MNPAAASPTPTRRMLTGNAAAAWGARLAGVDYIPAFPITPQTEIIELLSEWIVRREMPGRFVLLDCEHSMILAAGAAAATGVRAFSATSSQGLLQAMESLYNVSGWRTPFVLVNVSRALAAPITLGPDHNDVLAARDSGFIQIHAETCQETLDSILQAYRIAEHPQIGLPVLVNLDGFFLSFTREPVELPAAADAAAFVGPFQPSHPPFRAAAPVTHGAAVMDPAPYSYFRYQMHTAARAALDVHAGVAADFARRFGRQYDVVDRFELNDAACAIVMTGSFSSKGKAAVRRWRSQGHRVGLLRLRMLRPFPSRALTEALSSCSAVGVIDQNIAPGLGGILFQEVAAALASAGRSPPILRSFIGGLGGKDISDAEFEFVRETLERPAPADASPDPFLLMTTAEWQQVRDFQHLAGKFQPAPTP